MADAFKASAFQATAFQAFSVAPGPRLPVSETGVYGNVGAAITGVAGFEPAVIGGASDGTSLLGSGTAATLATGTKTPDPVTLAGDLT